MKLTKAAKRTDFILKYCLGPPFDSYLDTQPRCTSCCIKICFNALTKNARGALGVILVNCKTCNTNSRGTVAPRRQCRINHVADVANATGGTSWSMPKLWHVTVVVKVNCWTEHLSLYYADNHTCSMYPCTACANYGLDRSLSRVSKGPRANNCHGPRLALIRHCATQQKRGA